jgi:hypothetical protein
MWKSDAVAKETAILEAREVRRKKLPLEIQISLLVGNQKDRQAKNGRVKGFDLNLKREAEIARLFTYRYGGEDYVLPDDDAGRDDALLMVHHQVKLAHGMARARNWLTTRCPWMCSEEAEQIIARAHAQDWSFVADDLAERLGLTFAHRNALGITTIGAVDLDKAGRKSLRKVKDREYQATKRLSSGVTPRRLSLSHTKPWVADGISRRTWERRRKKSESEFSGAGCDILSGFRDIERHTDRVSQVHRQQDTKYHSSTDALATMVAKVDEAGRGLEAAPGHMPERVGLNSDLQSRESGSAADFLSSRGGWTAQLRAMGRISATATKITAIAEGHTSPLTAMQGRGRQAPRPSAHTNISPGDSSARLPHAFAPALARQSASMENMT